MKRTVKDLPIRHKLAFIDVATTAAALLLACGAFVTYEQVTFRRTMARDLAVTAQMIAFNTASAVSFEDASSAEQTLRALTVQPHVVGACVYDGKGDVFATFERDGKAPLAWPKATASGHYFDSTALHLFRPVVLGQETIGTIYLRSDLVELTHRRERYVLIAAITTVLATLAAFLLGIRLHRMISIPVARLADAIASVSKGGNRYAVRVAKVSDDELGQLTDGFNHMLARIEAHEAGLRNAQAELETRVIERTRELSIQVNERLRSEEERDRFFTLSLDLFCIATFEGAIRRANPAFETLGYGLNELQRMNYADLVHPDDHTVARLALNHLAAGGVLLNQEMRMRCADGSTRWFAWTAKPIPERNLFYACGRDISEMKRAESEREVLHRQLVDTSRHAGMAEVATSVLHNVGNVLNSVNVSATMISQSLRDARVSFVGQVGQLLREHESDLPAFLETEQGRQIPGFLASLGQHLVEVQSDVVRESESLRKNIDHIKEIVAMQQNYAKVSGVAETVGATQLVEDALEMNVRSFERHGIALERRFLDDPRVTVDKHKVLQILVNLLRNAEHACIESGRPDKRITARVMAKKHQVHIEVADNGVGISAENLTRIFNFGFTTRPSGHGFGLHSGANVARELGGALRAQSDGPGRGAVFTLVLPYQQKGKAI